MAKVVKPWRHALGSDEVDRPGVRVPSMAEAVGYAFSLDWIENVVECQMIE